jgi:hypothetical protein
MYSWHSCGDAALDAQLWGSCGAALRGRRCTYYRDPESSAQKHGPPPPTCHCESADPKHPQQGPPITSQPSPPDPVGRAMPGDALAMVCAHQDVPLGRGHIAGRELPLEAVVHLVGQPPEPVAATKRPHSQRIRRITSPLPRRPSPRRGVLSREGEPGRSLMNHSEPNHAIQQWTHAGCATFNHECASPHAADHGGRGIDGDARAYVRPARLG